RGLQGGEAVELVEHHVRLGVAAQLYDDPVAVAIGLVAHVGNAVDLPFADQLGDPLHHVGLVHLVRNFGDDDGFALPADRFDTVLAAHDDGAAAQMISGADAGAAQDDAAGRKIRTWYDLDEIVD